MLGDQRPGCSNNNSNSGNDNNDNNSGGGGGGGGDDEEYEVIRDIHALTPPQPPASVRTRRRESWEDGSHRLSSLSTVGSEALSEQLASMSREFNAMVLAGSTMQNGDRDAGGNNNSNNNLRRIGEEEAEETNPLAIVPDGGHPLDAPVVSSPRRLLPAPGDHGALAEVSLQKVKKEEVESKISAWQTAKIAKINNRFKREDVIFHGWESEQVEKATALFKKVERKLEEKRARAMEKMQNEAARAHRKAEEKRASSEAKRGTKVARILELANLMRAVGRAPSKRSFF